MEKKNPYAVSGAPVADRDQMAPADESNPLFAAGVAKVVVMSLVTFGVYELYWMYRHWRLRIDGESQGIRDSFSAGPLAGGYILSGVDLASAGSVVAQSPAARYAGPKGNLRFPSAEPLPLALIARIVRFKVKQDLRGPAKKKAKKK